MKDWDKIAEETKRTWIVRRDIDQGCPLDWVDERSISKLSAMGFGIVLEPGQTIEQLIATRMLKP